MSPLVDFLIQALIGVSNRAFAVFLVVLVVSAIVLVLMLVI